MDSRDRAEQEAFQDSKGHKECLELKDPKVKNELAGVTVQDEARDLYIT